MTKRIRATLEIIAAVMLGIGVAGPSHAGSCNVGVLGGVNVSTLSGQFGDFAQTQSTIGAAGGAFVDYSFSRILALRGEAYFSGKGGKWNGGEGTDDQGNPTGPFEDRVKLRYVDVPVLARVTLPTSETLEPYVVVGPLVGFALGGRFESEIPGLPSEDVTGLKSVDFGLVGGAGLQLVRGMSRFGIEAKYSRSLSDIYDIAGNLESLNSAFTIAVTASRTVK